MKKTIACLMALVGFLIHEPLFAELAFENPSPQQREGFTLWKFSVTEAKGDLYIFPVGKKQFYKFQLSILKDTEIFISRSPWTGFQNYLVGAVLYDFIKNIYGEMESVPRYCFLGKLQESPTLDLVPLDPFDLRLSPKRMIIRGDSSCDINDIIDLQKGHTRKARLLRTLPFTFPRLTPLEETLAHHFQLLRRETDSVFGSP